MLFTKTSIKVAFDKILYIKETHLYLEHKVSTRRAICHVTIQTPGVLYGVWPTKEIFTKNDPL